MKREHIVILFVSFALITGESFYSFLIFLPIIVITCFGLVRTKSKDFVPSDMLWFCLFLYFGIVPAQGFKDGYFSDGGPTNGIVFSNADILMGVTVVGVFLLSFLLAERLVKDGFESAHDYLYTGVSEAGLSNVVFYFLLCIVGFLGYVQFSGGIGNVLSSRVDRDIDAVNFLAFLFLAVGVVSNIYIIDSLSNRSNRNPFVFFAVGLGISFQVLCVNFFNSPRFFLVGSWLPLILVATGGRLNYKYIYGAIVVGIFLIMPILSITTRYGLGGNENYAFSFDDNLFLIKDVDIFETLVFMIGYVEKAGFQYGDNLLAIVLFFVPREMWPDKPIVGGLKIGWDLYNLGAATTPNLSFFIACDSYMDFGFVGVVIVGLLLGYFYKKYLLNISMNRCFRFEAIILISVLPIVIRGPVGAVIGYPLCLLVCSRFIAQLSRIKIGRLN